MPTVQGPQDITPSHTNIYICNIIYTGHIFLPIGISCLYRDHLVLIEPGYCISYALDENIERPISGPCAATRFQLPPTQQDKVQEPGSLDSKTTFPTSFSNSTDGTGSSRYHKILHAGYPYRTWTAQQVYTPFALSLRSPCPYLPLLVLALEYPDHC